MKSKEESFLSINKIATAGRGSTALLTCTTNITLLIVDCVVRHLNKPMASVSSLKKNFCWKPHTGLFHMLMLIITNKHFKFKYL